MPNFLQQQEVRDGETDCSNQESEWTEVVRRQKKGRRLPQPTKEIVQGPRPRPFRAKKPAIIIKAGVDVFPALAQKLRSEISSSTVRDKIVAMRQTKKGDMLIVIDGDVKAVEDVKEEITRVAGLEVSINELTQKYLLEVRDVDS